jgi:hypothetical protein
LSEPRWAYQAATASYFNPYPEPRWFAVKLRMSGAGQRRTVRLAVNAREQLNATLTAAEREFTLRVQLKPGPNHFDLESPEPAVRLSEERRQLRMFAVHEASVTLADGPDRPES